MDFLEPTGLQDGQPENRAGGETPPAQPAVDQKPLTREEMLQILSDFRKEEEKTRSRFANTINKRFERLKTAATQAGAQITPEVEKALRQEAEKQVNEETSQIDEQQPSQQTKPQPATTPAAKAGPVLGQATDPFIDLAKAFSQVAGVEIQKNDPEIEKHQLALKKGEKPDAKWLFRYQEAVREKKARAARESLPAGSLGSGGGGNPISSVKDPNELWKMARGK